MFYCLILTGFYRLWLIFFIDGSFFVPVQFYSVFLLITWDYAKRPLYCYVCMECFQGSYCLRSNSVACRKRVQRYAKFLNYQTFYGENFKEFYSKNNKRLNDNHLNMKKIFREF